MNTLDGQMLLTIFISALLFFSLGGLAGWLVSLLRNPNPPAGKTHPPSAEPDPEKANAPRMAAEGLSSTSPDPEKVELARIHRRLTDDQIFLETGGRLLEKPSDVLPGERTWLVLTAEAIYTLLGEVPTPAPPKAISQPAPAPLPPIAWQPAPSQEFQKPSMNPADVLIRAVQAGQPRIDRPKTLVEQIDAVLQEMLAQTPLPAGEVHLSENADLGLDVLVGNQRYNGLETVPDENIRRAIRNAIAEWQRRSQK